MNKIRVLSAAAALVVACASSPLFAAEKPTLEERCRAIAQQHGMQPQEIDAWVEKCMDHTKAMMERHKNDEQQPGGRGGQSAPEQKQKENGGK